MNYRTVYEEGKAALTAAGVLEAELDARLLLEHVCGTDRNTLLAHGEREVSDGERERYRSLVGKRADRIPLQYLTGTQDFMGLEFLVSKKALIPRQDTEVLVEEALRHLHDGMRVLDLCTGSGCILISLLYYSNNCLGVGTDISEEALQLAVENAKRLLGPETLAVQWQDGMACGRCVSFRQSDLFDRVEEKFDMIVSNPPYIRTEVLPELMPEVREHEPLLALDGGEDGLSFYRRIVRESKKCLMRGGVLLLEIGYDQGEAVAGLMEKENFLEVQVIKDYGGLDRVVCGTLGF
ncbi:MAG: peptide chain release factor N(5)-glutamine methyltransferase [bacterium]|nr:peptide chain release factor N(5)-glutamine methyltransferase [bacterium]